MKKLVATIRIKIKALFPWVRIVFRKEMNYRAGLFEPVRTFIVLILVVIIYLLPLGKKPQFIQQNDGIVEIPQNSQILGSFYPEGIYASCGDGGTGTNCHTGCCSAGACVVCPQEDPTPVPPPILPPTISSVLTCSQLGNNGWCRSNSQLILTASDPQGYALTITGNAGGLPISCNGSCTVNLPKGFGSAVYTATAAASGRSASGSKAWMYDPDSPSVGVNVSGTSGSNGWYVSTINASANGSDAISGLASALIAVDGGAAVGSAILSDGVHSVTATAIDVAGNISSKISTFSVDTIAPVIFVSAAGNQASNEWFSTPVDLSATASDATSGVMGSVTMSFDNGVTWVNGLQTLSDGLYDVKFSVLDLAGNTATSQMSFKIDTKPPSIILSDSGSLGRDGWYVSAATVSAEVSDNLSGVISTQYRLNGGAWQEGKLVTVNDGVYTIDFQAFDAAGNMQSVEQEIYVDTTPPGYSFDPVLNGSVLSGTVNMGGTALDKTSAVHDVEFSLDGTTWIAAAFAGTHWSIAWDSSVFDNGERELCLRVDDIAGNQGQPISVRIILDNDPPYVNLAETWNIWESGSLVVLNNVIPLKSVRIVVQDPMLRYPDQVIYDDTSAPATITWNRVIGPASAPPGSYTVNVEVCDIYGLCSIDTGTILIPFEPASISLEQPMIEIPNVVLPLPLFTQTPAPVLEQPIVIPASVVQTHTEVNIVRSSVWTLVVISAFLLSFALLLLTDPRPAAWRSLNQSLQHHIENL